MIKELNTTNQEMSKYERDFFEEGNSPRNTKNIYTQNNNFGSHKMLFYVEIESILLDALGRGEVIVKTTTPPKRYKAI